VVSITSPLVLGCVPKCGVACWLGGIFCAGSVRLWVASDLRAAGDQSDGTYQLTGWLNSLVRALRTAHQRRCPLDSWSLAFIRGSCCGNTNDHLPRW